MNETVWVVCGAWAATLLFVGGIVRYLDRRWRPILRAYLEARCQQAGAPMHVVDENAPPARGLLPPIGGAESFKDEDLDDLM